MVFLLCFIDCLIALIFVLLFFVVFSVCVLYLRVLLSDAVKFSDGLRSLEKLSYEDKTVLSNLLFIKNESSLHKFSRFASRNSNSKSSKHSEYSIDSGFTEKLRPLHTCSFERHLIH